MANTRTPEVTWGDIEAQSKTNFFGLKKLEELVAAYGKELAISLYYGYSKNGNLQRRIDYEAAK